MKPFCKYLIFILLIACSSAYALTFPLDGNEVFGKVVTVTPQHGDTFSRYARIYDVGAVAIQHANPGINEDYPDKQKKQIIIPSAFILPSQQQGIIINLPELRLYYFDQSQLLTFPVTIGREGWKTPIRQTKVVEKITNPEWHVPKSIQAESAAKGRHLPSVVKAGPNNPLGQYALRLDIPGYLIHGTNVPTSIGRRVSHGCIRMFPVDIEQLFNNVPVGTPVALINEPIKAGWRDNQLYLQVFPLLAEYPMAEDQRQALAKDAINNALKSKQASVDWNKVEQMMKQKSGIADVISN